MTLNNVPSTGELVVFQKTYYSLRPGVDQNVQVTRMPSGTSLPKADEELMSAARRLHFPNAISYFRKVRMYFDAMHLGLESELLELWGEVYDTTPLYVFDGDAVQVLGRDLPRKAVPAPNRAAYREACAAA